MEDVKTPLRKQVLSSRLNIPPSPFMKSLGYGTGVSVYELDRVSPSNSIQSPWAIKKVSKHKLGNKIITQRLCDEASILKKLNHPNIVGFRAVTSDSNGKICLAMEACTTSLGDLIETRYEDGLLAFEPECILKVANDIANALDYLHNDAYILHCDIKSYNVLVKDDFKICKLCDFGVAIRLNSDEATKQVSIEKEDPSGTLLWMAPETLKCRIMSDKTDIYSYGLVIWEMLALVPPPMPEQDTLDDSLLSTDSNISLHDLSDISESEPSMSNINTRKIGNRPELPSQEFTEDYNFILELFYCCTEEDGTLRPKASDLVVITKKMNESLIRSDLISTYK